ncbi:hypothetical protein K5D33_07530 [Pseudomonas cichorii]|nr:hypothetical protein [Pseudomonas cichorii]MBX8534575.1 hypothetical protein [Pseudomonas cichorii]
MTTIAVEAAVICVWQSVFTAASAEDFFLGLFIIWRIFALAVLPSAMRAFCVGEIAERANPADTGLIAVTANHAHAHAHAITSHRHRPSSRLGWRTH